MRLWIVALALSACEPSPPPLAATSEHFMFFADDPEVFCPGAVADYERHYLSLTSWLGDSLRPGVRISVYRHASDEELWMHCPRGSAACARGRAVHIVEHVPHELIHAYSTTLIGRPPVLFQEGLAEVLGSGLVSHSPVDATPEIRAQLESAEWRAADRTSFDYTRAAGFVRALIETFGREPFLRLYAAMEHDANTAAIDAAFRDSLGVSLDEAIDAWIAGPAQTRMSAALRVFECDAPPLVEEVPLGCAMTLPGNDGYTASSVLARVPVAPGGAALRWRAAGELFVQVAACPSSERAATDVAAYVADEHGMLFWDGPPGDAWIYAGAGRAEGSSIAPAALGPLMGESCAGAPVHMLPADLDRLVIHGPLERYADDDPIDGGPDVAVRFEVAASCVVRVRPGGWWLMHDVERVSFCEDDCARCVTGELVPGVDPFEPRALEPGRTYALRIAGTPAGRGYHVELSFER